MSTKLLETYRGFK